MNITQISKTRSTTKVYNSAKKISPELEAQIYALLQNSPSSVNSQPWHFVIAKSDEAKKKILDGIYEFNHARVRDASHVVIICVKTQLDDNYLEHLLEQEDKDGRFPTEKNKEEQRSGRGYFVRLNRESPEFLYNWTSRQAYIALGTLLLGAAALGIDATPIEGFRSDTLDEILGLKEQGLRSVVVASLGYRSEDDFNANLPKSRLPQEELFTIL